MKLGHQKTAFLTAAAGGLALLMMMVLVEGEPGAIPLLLLLVGLVGYLHCRLRERFSRPRS